MIGCCWLRDHMQTTTEVGTRPNFPSPLLKASFHIHSWLVKLQFHRTCARVQALFLCGSTIEWEVPLWRGNGHIVLFSKFIISFLNAAQACWFIHHIPQQTYRFLSYSSNTLCHPEQNSTYCNPTILQQQLQEQTFCYRKLFLNVFIVVQVHLPNVNRFFIYNPCLLFICSFLLFIYYISTF